jgi:sialate O-acetylesterase
MQNVLPLSLALILASAAAVGRADVRLASIFSDHMMLQRDQPIRVWGHAEPGEAVRVKLGGAEASTQADAEGRWLVTLPALKEGRDLELNVTGKNPVVVRDVIVGDIWVCSGQSNMEWSMGVSDAAEDIKTADFPDIRRVKVNHVESPRAEENAPIGSPWKACTPQTAGDFTAVGFYFARDVLAATGVPVGIIDDNWGGTAIEGWVAPEALDLVPELAAAAEGRRKAIADHRAALPGRIDEVERWVAATRQALAADTATERLPVPPAWPVLPNAGGWGQRYNAMVHPLIRLPVKGFLWYQGEANGGEGDSYRHKMHALVKGWRKAWGNDDLPFYFVQLASFQDPTDNPAGGDGWAKLREAQRHSLALPHTGMAVITDTVPLAARGDIHPRNKFDVGKRLARWALNRDYGKADVVPSGPLFKSLAIEGDKARVTFEHVGGGLMVGRKEGKAPPGEDAGGKLKRFAIAGEDKKWHWADAVIVEDAVVVSSSAVPKPVAVRYAFSMNPDGANLYNRAGLPASPFRTDDW